MQISGLAHPSLMRAATTLSMDELGDNADGTVNVIMTSKTETVATAVIASVLQFRTALEVYARRIEQPASR